MNLQAHQQRTTRSFDCCGDVVEGDAERARSAENMCSTDTTKFVARMETPLHTCTAYDELAKKNDSSGCITGCMIMLFDWCPL